MTYKLPKNKYKARSVTACENCGAVNVPLFTEIDGSGAAYSFYNPCYCRECYISEYGKDPTAKQFNGKCEICKTFKTFNDVKTVELIISDKAKTLYCCDICRNKLKVKKND